MAIRVIHRTVGGHGIGEEDAMYERYGELIRIEGDRAIILFDGCVGADNVPLAEIRVEVA